MLLIMASLAWAQPAMQSAPAETRNPAIASVPEDGAEGLIHLDVVVTDASGKPIAGLNPANFSLLENGRPQKILSFDAFDNRGAGAEPSVKIILLIDTIALPPELTRAERLAVEAYLQKDGGRLAHPVSVFLLSDIGLWTVTHPSSDGSVLAREVDRNEYTLVRHNRGWQSPGRGLGDEKDTAQDSALKALGQIATDERRSPDRKLLVWVGPGWGTGSGQYADTARGSGSTFGAAGRVASLFDTVWWFSTLLREARLVLYSFTVGENDPSSLSGVPDSNTAPALGQIYKGYLDGVRDPRKATFMNLYRNVLAVQSGGRVMNEGQDLVQQIEHCVQDAGPYYRISFDPFPADHPHEYHDLKIEVDRPGLVVRTNTGYYDQPFYVADPIPAPRRISIAELQRMLELDESDADKARQLIGCELAERLSERRLASLEEIAHGKRTREQLRILADVSSFLRPPADEIPGDPPPDAAAQRQMLSLMVTYLTTTIHKLPDLFARQTTVRYQETPMYLEGPTRIDYKPLHITDSWTTTVRNRNGFEITEAKPPKRKPNEAELITYGVFGPVLNGVVDTIHKSGDLTWERWEQVATGNVAIFRSVTPSEKSIYEVWLCCLPDGDGNQAFHRFAAYHVEIGIDPQSGAILRLQFQVDLKSTTPMSRSDIMVEYAPVQIGGKTYICPLRSVSIGRPRSVQVLTEWDESFRSWGPFAAMLNDITFDGYHMFRSESHILPGFAPSQ
jgi:VWFA-related protein